MDEPTKTHLLHDFIYMSKMGKSIETETQGWRREGGDGKIVNRMWFLG